MVRVRGEGAGAFAFFGGARPSMSSAHSASVGGLKANGSAFRRHVVEGLGCGCGGARGAGAERGCGRIGWPGDDEDGVGAGTGGRRIAATEAGLADVVGTGDGVAGRRRGAGAATGAGAVSGVVASTGGSRAGGARGTRGSSAQTRSRRARHLAGELRMRVVRAPTAYCTLAKTLLLTIARLHLFS